MNNRSMQSSENFKFTGGWLLKQLFDWYERAQEETEQKKKTCVCLQCSEIISIAVE